MAKTEKELQEVIEQFLPGNALDALQRYTPLSSSWKVDENQEASSTLSNTSYRQLVSDLVFNSVDEEDEFLYGDSSPISEEKTSVNNAAVTYNTGRIDTGWSDEEPCNETTCCDNLNKVNSGLEKNLSDYDSQKTQDTVKFPHIKEEKIIVEADATSADVSAEGVPHKLKSSGSISLPEVEKNGFTSSRIESKSHIAAEILNREASEKTNVSSSINNKSEGFAGTCKNHPAGSSLSANLESDKPAYKRQFPMTINKKHIDNIRDYISRPPRKKPFPREEGIPPEKHSRCETSKNHSPLRHRSPPHRYSLTSTYKHESYRVKHASSYSKYGSASFQSESHSRHLKSHGRLSSTPKKWSRSPDYRHRRRSREKSTDYDRCKDRSSRSTSAKCYSSRSKTHDKEKSKSNKKSYYSRKREKSNFSSSDSFRSLSLGSSTDSSDESTYEQKSSKKRLVKRSRSRSRSPGYYSSTNNIVLQIHCK